MKIMKSKLYAVLLSVFLLVFFFPAHVQGAKLANLSARGMILTGESVLIGGFIVNSPMTAFIRARGTSLYFYGVNGALGDPVLRLYDQNNILVAQSDNWTSESYFDIITALLSSIYTNQQDIDYFSGLEPALLLQLDAGAYTVVVEGLSQTTGIGTIDLYDITNSETGHLTNLAARGHIQTGEGIIIGGFIVEGYGSFKVFILARGPSLTQYGIVNALPDPRFTVMDRNMAVVATSDNWSMESQAGDISAIPLNYPATGIQVPHDLEPASIVSLEPGPYTVLVEGNGSTGIGTIEIFALTTREYESKNK